MLRTPKTLYYRWSNGEEMNPDELTTIIDDSIHGAKDLKAVYQKRKMELSWNEYKRIMERFLKRTFDNCKLIEDYEDKTIINKLIYDFIIEDNFYIKYICNCLDGEMMKWQKERNDVRDHKKYKHCQECGKLIEKTNNKKLYCTECAANKERERKRNNAYKYRKLKVAK